VAMTLVTFTDHRAFQGVQRGKQGGGAIVLVVVGEGCNSARVSSPTPAGCGPGPVSGSFRRHTALRGLVRRVHVQPHDPCGLVGSVASTIASILSALISGLRPRPSRISIRAFTPSSTKRLRQSNSVGRVIPSSTAISLLDTSSDASKMARARKENRCGV